MPASFPTSVKAFTTKNTNDTIQASHVDDLQDEVTAIETLLLGGSAGDVLTAGSPPSYQTAATRPVEETTIVTGSQNDFDLDGPFTYLRCTGAAPVFTGFTVAGSAPSAGDRVIIDCLGATSVKVAHQDNGSVAANRIICESTTGQIVGVGGRLLLVYDGTTDRWRATALSPGDWIAVTFAAGDFTASASMTWTVAAPDVTAFRYRQLGTLVQIDLIVEASTVGGTPSTYLQVTLPNGFATTAASRTFVLVDDNAGGIVGGFMDTTAAGTLLKFGRTAGANWSAATNATAVAFMGVLRVN
jgi:hypothetical protein